MVKNPVVYIPAASKLASSELTFPSSARFTDLDSRDLHKARTFTDRCYIEMMLYHSSDTVTFTKYNTAIKNSYKRLHKTKSLIFNKNNFVTFVLVIAAIKS